MSSKQASSLIECFSILPDPRRKNHNNKKHELLDIVIIAILAVTSNAETWVDIESFGKARYKWLKKFLSLKNGIPSHDTFARVFSILEPKAFQECFLTWVENIRIVTKGEVIAIDGKTVRRSHSKDGNPIHIVSAWASDNGISLGQLSVDSKTNEIKVIPDLLDMLMLKGCIVTTDAMGCQTKIAKKIIENKGDYVLAVKGNQKKLLHNIRQSFNSENEECDYMETKEQSHGRRETRECWVVSDLASIGNIEKWANLTTLAKVTDTRIIKGKESTATRYFISSLDASAEKH